MASLSFTPKRGAGHERTRAPFQALLCLVAVAGTAAGFTVPCAAAVTTASAAPAGAIAAAKATGLVLMVHKPAGTAEDDNRNDDRRQVEVSRQKFHHRNPLLSGSMIHPKLLGSNSLLGIELNLVDTLVLVGAEQQVDREGDNSDSNDGEEVEANLTGDQAADLVNDQRSAVGQQAHIADGDGRPLAVVHLALDGAHSSEAGSAQQVEDHEAVSGDRGEVGSNLGPDLIAVLRKLVSIVIQNTEGTDNILLGNQAGDRSNGRTPIAEALRDKDPGNCACNDSQNGVVLILDHREGTVLEAEALQEPQDDGRGQNDGAGTLDEGPAALPSGAQDIAPCGHMVSGQLHNERSRITGEQLRLFQDDAGDDDGRKADKVSGGGNPAAAAEQSTCEQADDGHLSAAGDEAGGHDRHTAVTLVLDGTGSHNTGNAAAGADQHGDEALAGQAEAAEDAVHDEGNAGHVADILQNGQQEEQNEHLGNKAQNRADTGNDAVHDQAVQPVSHADGFQQAAEGVGDDLTEQNIVGPVSGKGADADAAVRNGGAHCDGVHQPHDGCEDRQRQNTVCDELVDLIGGGQVLGAGLLFDGLVYNAVDVGIALVGDDALSVIIHFLLAVSDVGINVVKQFLAEVQLGLHLVITLKQLDGVPAQEAVIDLALNGLLDVGDGMLHAAGKDMGQLACLALLGGGNGQLGGLLAALVLQGGDLDGLAAQFLGQLVQVDLVAVLADEVDHVDGHDHGDAQLNKLGGQIKVALDVGAVNDVEDGIRLFVDKVAAGNNFLQRVGRQRVDTGKVLNHDIVVTLQLALLLLNGNAGPVADILVRTGQAVEQGGFTAVRVACQSNFNCHVGYTPFLKCNHSTSIISASALRTLSS